MEGWWAIEDSNLRLHPCAGSGGKSQVVENNIFPGEAGGWAQFGPGRPAFRTAGQAEDLSSRKRLTNVFFSANWNDARARDIVMMTGGCPPSICPRKRVFRFSLPGDEPESPVTGEGQVVWMTHMQGMGVRFTRLSDDDQARLEAYLSRR
jgi:hypothetical protein